MIIVSDTSPLCNLALVDHLCLLKSIYQTVIIPTIVADELKAATNSVINVIPDLDWIHTHVPTNTTLTTQLQRDKGLDTGEANAIALALELQADDLLIDERLGRREATHLGLSIIGILGILITAKQRNLITKVQPVMDALIHQASFRISPQLYQQVLTLASEP